MRLSLIKKKNNHKQTGGHNRQSLDSKFGPDSPCSPSRNAYSLDKGQDTLKEKDEEEGHEVEGAISPVNSKGKHKVMMQERFRAAPFCLILTFYVKN